jgi:hypothetical protein
MKLLTILSLFCGMAGAAFAQSATGGSPASYGVSVVASESGAASVVTVQGNQLPGVRLLKTIALKGFDVTCSVACTVTLERDGAAATATTQAIVQLNGEYAISTANAYAASNVGVGTVLAQYSLTAGGQIAISLAGKQLYSGTENITIRTSSITGTVNTNLQWTEQ